MSCMSYRALLLAAFDLVWGRLNDLWLRPVQGFQEALKEHEEQLVKDPVVHTHLSALYDTLLEQNLIRLIEPFSCVQIQHLAELISLPLETVLNKLAQVRHPSYAVVKLPE